MSVLALSLAGTFLLGCHAPQKAPGNDNKFTVPTPERVTALLDFAGPVKLVCRVATSNDLARAKPRKGVPLASFLYSDSDRSSDSIRVTVYKAGSFYGAERARLQQWLKDLPVHAPDPLPAFGTFRAKDGRPIHQFPAGMGPGGAAYCALIPCRDSRYELVISQSTNFHDDEDGKEYAHHVSPRKDLKSIIEEVERLVVK